MTNIYFGFHRLCVNGLDASANQPFNIKNCTLICNGEIYNYKTLKEGFNDDYKSSSDCEVIIHLYKKYGFRKMLRLLDGVYAMVLYDHDLDLMFVARDPIGIRPLFMGSCGNDEYAFCSEAKAILFCSHIRQFPPGNTWCSNKPNFFESFYANDYLVHTGDSEEAVCRKVRQYLTEAVDKRLMSDRKIGCLLSGGLDSSLVAMLLARHFKPGELSTYSIGMAGSVDLKWARKVADFLKTDHHEICLTEEDFLNAIDQTVYQTESYCTTTIRASVGNYLVSKYIRDNTDDTVIFCGDVSDEIFGSYRGFMQAPDEKGFHSANVKMLNDIHYFDVLRSDRSISSNGLESRVPFADITLVQYVMSLPAKYKTFGQGRIEKHILREAFRGDLPDDILERRKEAFSDGVSSEKRNWFTVIQEYISDKVPEYPCKDFCDPKPYDKESFYYRQVFTKYFGDIKLVPYYWRHPFCKEKDPSARLLKCY